jgi:ribbon-helix-helix CopG family protein
MEGTAAVLEDVPGGVERVASEANALILACAGRMRTLTLKVPRALAIRLNAAVRRRGTTQSRLIREALEAHLVGARRRSGSCFDLAEDLAGSVTGSSDLSYNKRRLRHYGR